MELNKINSSGNWGKAADDLNQNFSKVNNAVEQVKNATTRNKGYFSSEAALKSAFKSASFGDIAYVGSAFPYQTWAWNGSEWVKKNDNGGQESVNLGNYYTKSETDGKFTETDEKLSELGSEAKLNIDDYKEYTSDILIYLNTRLDNNGEEITNESWITSDFIPIDSNVTSIVTSSVNTKLGGICFYTDNKKFVKVIQSEEWNNSESISRFKVYDPLNLNGYVRFTYLNENARLNEGVSPFYAKFYSYKNKALYDSIYFDVINRDKNLHYKTTQTDDTFLDPLYTPQTVVYGNEILTKADGLYHTGELNSEFFVNSDFIEIDESVTHILISEPTTTNNFVDFYDSNKGYISSLTSRKETKSGNIVKIAKPINAKYIKVLYHSVYIQETFDILPFVLKFSYTRHRHKCIDDSYNFELTKYPYVIKELGIEDLKNIGEVYSYDDFSIPYGAEALDVTLISTIANSSVVFKDSLYNEVSSVGLGLQERGNNFKRCVIAIPKNAVTVRIRYFNESAQESYAPFVCRFISSNISDKEYFEDEILTIQDKRINPNGEELEVSNWICSDYVFCEKEVDNVEITLPGSSGCGLACYDIDKNYIGTIYGETGNWHSISKVKVVQETRYIRASYLNISQGLKEKGGFMPFRMKINYSEIPNYAIPKYAKQLEPISYPINQNTFDRLVNNPYYLRIPFCEVTNLGTIIVGADIRENNSGDQTIISIGIVRSEDGGKTFKDAKIIIPSTYQTEWDRVMDATILVNRNNNDIWVFAHKIPTKNMWETTHEIGSVSDNFDCFYTKSSDDGISWDTPKSLKELLNGFGDNVVTMFGGVGNGLTMSDGTLVLPIQCKMASSNNGGANGMIPDSGNLFNIQSGLIYSKDNGVTWARSNNLLPCYSSECNIVESDRGKLIINARGYISQRRIYQTDDLGTTWERCEADLTLKEPNACQGSFHNVFKGYNRVGVFCNPRSRIDRVDITVQKTYNYKDFYSCAVLSKPYRFGYSCICSDLQGNVFVAIENIGNEISLFDVSKYIF